MIGNSVYCGVELCASMYQVNFIPLNNKAALTSFELGVDDFRTVQKPALKL